MKNKINLKKQGFYKEMTYGSDNDSSIKDVMNIENDLILIEKICQYLNNGVVIVECCGTTIDAINSDNGVAGVPSLLTDGVWVWPGDLSYYVKQYNIKLTDDFVAMIKENNFNITIKKEDLFKNSIYIDGIKLL